MKEVVKYIDSIKSDIVFRIGENSQDNFDIIDLSNPQDIWFHVSNLASEHVIATIPTDKNIDKKQLNKIIIQGAVLCKQYSKHSSNKNLPIVYAKIKDVEKTEKVGCVTTSFSKIVII